MAKDDLVGEQLGNFTIVELIGEGPMARVYRARHEKLQRDVALKVIRRIPGDHEDARARFQREKAELQQLEHPHIIPIYDYAANSEYLWIASPLVKGGNLKDMLENGPLPLIQAVGALLQIAGAVDVANEMGIVHRNIKPSNVLVDNKEGRVHLYLTDFGVTKIVEAGGLTAPGVTLGTPEYMSPEQALGSTLDGRSDQYALALLFYELVNGKPPFTGKGVDVMQQHAKCPPPSLSKVLHPEVEMALFKGLAKDPSKRYKNCIELAAALAAAARKAPQQPVATALPHSPKRLTTGSPLPKVAVGVVAVVGVLGALLLGKGNSVPPAHLSPLVYCRGEELVVRDSKGVERSLGAGRYPRAWPGNPSLLLASVDLGKTGLDLFRVDLGNGERQNLTQHPGPEQVGSVAPDGKSFVFCSNREGSFQLYRGDFSKNKPARLSHGKSRHQWPSFSPSGDQVAYCDDADGTLAIWIYNIATKKSRRLSTPSATESDLYPAWGPDGQQLVFERKTGEASHLRIVVLKDGQERALAAPASPHQPSWSPSTQIAYSAGGAILALTPGGIPTPVIESKTAEWPAWLP